MLTFRVLGAVALFACGAALVARGLYQRWAGRQGYRFTLGQLIAGFGAVLGGAAVLSGRSGMAAYQLGLLSAVAMLWVGTRISRSTRAD